MKQKWNPNAEYNETLVPLKAFMEYYNSHVPASFPQATEKALKAFKKSSPSLFVENGLWSIDRHRKRVMDWLPSYKEEPAES